MTKNNFDKDGFLIIKKAISKELAEFCFDYINLKRKGAGHSQPPFLC